MEKIEIRTKDITLNKFIKWANISQTGSEGKIMIEEGLVKVNGEETKIRNKKLVDGDIVKVKGIGEYKVVKEK